MPRKLKKKIHVNQHMIRANAKQGLDNPVFTVKTYNILNLMRIKLYSIFNVNW